MSWKKKVHMKGKVQHKVQYNTANYILCNRGTELGAEEKESGDAVMIRSSLNCLKIKLLWCKNGNK